MGRYAYRTYEWTIQRYNNIGQSEDKHKKTQKTKMMINTNVIEKNGM